MTTLTPPYRLLSLGDGDDVTFTASRYELGDAADPHGLMGGRGRAPMLRVWIPGSHTGSPDDYLDFTSRRLIAELPALLAEFAGTGARIRILADGVPPRTIYTVAVEPA